jgi:cytidylate kinase
LATRAARRQQELIERGELVDLEDIKANLGQRDEIDSNRKESPLLKVADAVEIDTSNLTFAEQVAQIVHLAKQIIKQTEDYASNHR